jgi:hypothetical protein
MWRGRRRRWPAIDLYQRGGRSTINILSRADLDQLMSEAAHRGWNAIGRPDWFRQHADQFRTAMLTVFGSEGSGLWRCIVTVILADGSGGRFTLDVSTSALEALDELDDRSVVVLAHRYLATFSPVDLDVDQASTWDQSVWRSWGEG